MNTQEIRNYYLNKFINYLIKLNINDYTYINYLNACEYLGLNMSGDKNRYPHDFKKWYYIRIDQYYIQKALDDKKQKKSYTQTWIMRIFCCKILTNGVNLFYINLE